MSTMRERYEEKYCDIVDAIDPASLEDEDTLASVKVLRVFSECQPPDLDDLELAPAKSKWGKFKKSASKAWDNETTRALIKAGGAFAGVALVVHTTIRNDHILEKQALNQANQRPS